MTDRKKPSVVFWATVVLAVVLALGAYMSAYDRMMTPVQWMRNPSDDMPEKMTVIYHGFPDDLFWQEFFAPANWLDRRLRPNMWATN